jgi:hypothetical protein
MDRVELAERDSIIDRVLAEAERPELLGRNPAMLAGGESSDAVLGGQTLLRDRWSTKAVVAAA